MLHISEQFLYGRLYVGGKNRIAAGPWDEASLCEAIEFTKSPTARWHTLHVDVVSIVPCMNLRHVQHMRCIGVKPLNSTSDLGCMLEWHIMSIESCH